MSVFVVRYQMTFNYESVCRYGATFSSEVDIEASGPDTARRKLTPELALHTLALALEQDPSFNHNYDNFDLKIRNIEEKTL